MRTNRSNASSHLALNDISGFLFLFFSSFFSQFFNWLISSLEAIRNLTTDSALDFQLFTLTSERRERREVERAVDVHHRHEDDGGNRDIRGQKDVHEPGRQRNQDHEEQSQRQDGKHDPAVEAEDQPKG